MKKILAITCHQITNPLIHTVNYFAEFPENVVLLHVDKKSNRQDFEFLTQENVVLIDERVEVQWGGASQIAATLSLMRVAENYQYDYFFLLSGDDIPVQTDAYFNDFLRTHQGDNFIHYQDGRNTYIDPLPRVKYTYPAVFFNRKTDVLSRTLRVLHRFARPYLFKNKRYFEHADQVPALHKGTNWFGLTEHAVKYVLDFVASHHWYVPMFDRSLCADEVFFHTIIKSSAHHRIYNNATLMNNALRYIDWVSGPQYPRILAEDDFDKIAHSQMLLARKLPKDASPEFMRSFIQG